MPVGGNCRDGCVGSTSVRVRTLLDLTNVVGGTSEERDNPKSPLVRVWACRDNGQRQPLETGTRAGLPDGMDGLRDEVRMHLCSEIFINTMTFSVAWTTVSFLWILGPSLD